MKNSKIYPWIVVALLWVVALLNYLDRPKFSPTASYVISIFIDSCIVESICRSK